MLKNTQNATIILLTVTASILIALLVGIYAGSGQPAQASAVVKQGNFIMAAGEWGFSQNAELIYVIDITSRRLNVYYISASKKPEAIEMIDSVDLDKLFSTAVSATPKDSKEKERNGSY